MTDGLLPHVWWAPHRGGSVGERRWSARRCRPPEQGTRLRELPQPTSPPPARRVRQLAV